MAATTRQSRASRPRVPVAAHLAVVAIVVAACGGAQDAPLGNAGIGAARSTADVESGGDPSETATAETGTTEAAQISNPTAPEPIQAETTIPPTTLAPPRSGVDGPVRSVSIGFTGDVLPHSPLWRGAAANAGGSGYDFRPMFASIAAVVERPDISICHLETPIAPEGEDFSTDPLYGVPAEIVDAIAFAGHDRCSTASNHVLDRGVAGIDRTIDVLEAAGISQAGSARIPAEIEPATFVVNGVAISHLSYTYGTNGIPVPSDQPWRTRLIDVEQILTEARAARQLGSEFTIVSLHWGKEKIHEPTAEQRAIADELTASGFVDLIVGHHAHVVQPIEQINGVWVAFGLGDILSNLPAADHWPAASQDGIVVEFDITVGGGEDPRVTAPTVTPTWVDKNSGWVIRNVVADLSDPTIAEWRRAELEASLARTSAIVGNFVG